MSLVINFLFSLPRYRSRRCSSCPKPSVWAREPDRALGARHIAVRALATAAHTHDYSAGHSGAAVARPRPLTTSSTGLWSKRQHECQRLSRYSKGMLCFEQYTHTRVRPIKSFLFENGDGYSSAGLSIIPHLHKCQAYQESRCAFSVSKYVWS